MPVCFSKQIAICFPSCRKCQIHWLRICWVQLSSLWHWESLQWICRSEWGGLHPVSWARAPVAVAPGLSGGLQGVQITGHTGLQHWSGGAVCASQPLRLGISFLLGTVGIDPSSVLHHWLWLLGICSSPFQPVLQDETRGDVTAPSRIISQTLACATPEKGSPWWTQELAGDLFNL